MRKICKKPLCAVLTAALLLAGMTVPGKAEAKAKIKISKSKLTMTVGTKKTLKIKGTKKKVTWSSNKKKVATVSKKGVVKAKKKGTAKITAKVGKKKYTCKVTVKAKKVIKVTEMPVTKKTAVPQTTAGSTNSPNNTTNPGNTNSPSNTSKPQATPGPGKTDPPAATEQPVPTIGAQTPAPTSAPTGSTGGPVDLQGRAAFQVGSYQLALGLTKSEVDTVLGSLATDVKREEKSPQGFDVIAFRPNGGNDNAEFDAKYSTCILIYLKDNVVVGFTAIAPSVSYGDVISTEKTAAELESGGWSPAIWYDTTNNRTGAYTKEANDANVIGFVDSYGDNHVYCIQVFSSQYSVDDMTDPSKTTCTLDYSDAVNTAMATETGELLNAYMVNYSDKGAMRINSKLAGVADAYSKVIAANGATDASQAGRSSADLKEALIAASATPKSSWGEHILIGNMDAVGFANSMIESEQGRDKLHNSAYSLMGLGASASMDGDLYYPILVVDFIDFISNM